MGKIFNNGHSWGIHIPTHYFAVLSGNYDFLVNIARNNGITKIDLLDIHKRTN